MLTCDLAEAKGCTYATSSPRSFAFAKVFLALSSLFVGVLHDVPAIKSHERQVCGVRQVLLPPKVMTCVWCGSGILMLPLLRGRGTHQNACKRVYPVCDNGYGWCDEFVS